MSGLRIWSVVVVLGTAVVLTPVRSLGQEPPRPVTYLQFDFADPGARSMGFGGAFIGLADDATAAFANPAGLVQLGRPEISIEGRRTSFSTPYTAGGRVEGDPSGIGIDSTAGLRTKHSENAVSGLSFFSVAYPRNRWSVAIFRHQLANFEYFAETQGLFGGGTDCCQRRFYDQRTRNNFDFVNYGLSGAYRFGESLSLGLGLMYFDASLSATTDAYGVDDDSVQAIFQPTSFLPERWLYREVASIDDSDWVATGGFLWQVSKRWRVGGVYRQGPRVETALEFVAGRLVDFGVPPGEVFLATPKETVELPSFFGLGASFRAPGDRLTVSLQWDQVRYSSVPESLGILDATVDDADQLRLGGEYVFERPKSLIAIRAGAWLDPDHQLRTTDEAPFLQAVLPPGEDEMHYSAGLGVALERFQLDFGLDLSARVETASISMIYSF